MYRFLITPRWLGLAALMVLLAVIMVGLGGWQLDRYRQRSEINARIDRATRSAPAELSGVVAAPAGGEKVGRAPVRVAEWSRVTVTGRYDQAYQVLVRGRTLDGRVGYEVVTPLRLDDGSAVLIDRGWLPYPPGAATAAPDVPPAPAGPVTVVGRVRLSESGAAAPIRRAGQLEVRRIAPARLAGALPYPVFHAYLTLDSQEPPADRRFAAIPVRHENDWQNAGYTVQWWSFAVLTLVGYGYLARREARTRAEDGGRAAPPAPVG